MANFGLNLSDLNGDNGFIINGIDAGDLSGVSVSSAGDVNGDGNDDLIVGATGADPNGIDGAGESYVVFGSDNPSSSLNLSDLDGTNGFILNGIDADDVSGISVSSAGDVNGDGLDGFIIGASYAAPNGIDGAGESYVVFSSDNPSSSLNLSDLDGTNGFTINGIDTGDRSGFSVSSAGDVNGDGLDDFIIGARFANNDSGGSGESYVVFGSDNPSSSLNLDDLNGTNGFTLNGIGNSLLSHLVSKAGDVNGDGLDDLIVGAYTPFFFDFGVGESYVVFGSDNPSSNLNLDDLDGTNGFTLDGIEFDNDSFVSVSGAGDVNGDGFDDLIIGGTFGGPPGVDAGESYVVFGSDNPSSNLNLDDLDGTNGFTISGIDVGDYSGRSVSGAGDINGDGLDDLIIGAFRAGPNGIGNAGESYVVFGRNNPSSSLNLSDLDGTNGFTLNGIDVGDRSGFSVSGAGDFNDDGFDDLIIGAPSADPSGNNSGESYVVFGKATTNRVEEGLQALYTFDAGAGNTVFDRSNVGTPLNLQIADTDSVVWGNDGTLSVDDALITSAGAATKVYDAITATEEITIEAWVTPENDTQDGPSRIVSLSENTVNRNFTLGQDDDAYNVRLRTTTTGSNGISPSISSPDGLLTTDLTHVVYTRESDGDVRLYLDNELVVEDTLTGDFSTWDPNYELSLANELTGDRPWAGSFDLVAIYNQSFDDGEVNQNFLAGAGALAPSGGDDILPGFQASSNIASSNGALLPGTENLDIFALSAAQPF